MDPRLGHRVPPRGGRREPLPRPPDGLSHAARRARLVGRHPPPREGVLRAAPRARDRHARHLPRPRPLPLLRLLGGHARPDGVPDRRLGRAPARLRGDQVRPLHDDRQPPHAGRHPLPRLAGEGADGRLRLRLRTLSRPPPGRARAALPVRGLRPGLRHQGTALPVPHLASRRARRGADRRLGDPRRGAAQDGHLRLPPLRDPALPGGGRDRVARRRGARRRGHTARWWRRCSPT